jgi:hypothetical protein
MDCVGCPQAQPVVAPGNLGVWWFYRHSAPLLRDGLGGISGPGIETALRLLGAPAAGRPEMLRKLLILLSETQVCSAHPMGGTDGE